MQIRLRIWFHFYLSVGEAIYFAGAYWNSCLDTDVLVAIFSTQSMSVEFLMDDYCLVVQNVISVH